MTHRREANRVVRAELDAARQRGLRARHAAKLRHLQQKGITMTNPDTPPEHKLPLAKLFAECEDKGLGTWQPSFQAHSGMENTAAGYIEARLPFFAKAAFGEDR